MVTIWAEKMEAQQIRDTGDLLNSFTREIEINARGEVEKITHSFLYYGRMVDMGVGKGVDYYSTPKGRRRPKPWYNEKYISSVKALTEKIAQLYGEEFTVFLSDNLNGEIT
jgi:hypothetical protein